MPDWAFFIANSPPKCVCFGMFPDSNSSPFGRGVARSAGGSFFGSGGSTQAKGVETVSRLEYQRITLPDGSFDGKAECLDTSCYCYIIHNTTAGVRLFADGEYSDFDSCRKSCATFCLSKAAPHKNLFTKKGSTDTTKKSSSTDKKTSGWYNLAQGLSDISVNK